MLYDRWRQIALQFANDRALTDAASGTNWTFAQLARAAETLDTACEFVFPQSNSSLFILEVLRGWRSSSIVCPLDAGSHLPAFENIPRHIRHIKLTSGTTSSPRALLFTESQLAADAENIVRTMGLSAETPNLSFISLAHSYGFSNLVTPLLLHGIPLILGGHPLPEMIKTVCKLAKRVTLPAVPALWRSWADAGAIPGNVNLAISAGAPLSLSLESEIFHKYGLKIHNFYGATECGGIAYDRTDQVRSHRSLIGTAMCGVSLAIASESCLSVQSLAVAERYWGGPDSRLHNGIFQTSDIAEIHGGSIFVNGRATDQLNLAGRKVLPESIEELVLLHPNVSKCVVFGIPSNDGERTDVAIGAVVRTGSLSAQELTSFLLQRLPAWQIPRRWWFVESLEENGRGKIARGELRKSYLNTAEQ